MAVEACTFQLTSTAPAATPITMRACISKEKKLSFLTNKEPKRSLSSFLPPPSIPLSSIPGRARTSLICQATNIVNEVLEVKDDSWDELILGSKIPVLVVFSAPSCGPCKMVEPVMNALAKEYAGKVACYKINTDNSVKMASQYGIREVPTLLLFKNGEKQESITGASAVRKSALCATIDKYLGV